LNLGQEWLLGSPVLGKLIPSLNISS